MANFFKSLFGSNRKSETVNIVEPESQQVPSADLFVESQAPAGQESNPGLSRVKFFLGEDHYSAGRKEGYEIHSEEGLTIGVNELKSIFILKVNAVQEYLSEEVTDLKKRMIDLGDMMPNLKAQLELDIEQIEEKIEELKFQKMMSVEEEGWIAPVLYAYKKGFQKGTKDFFDIADFNPGGIL